MSFVGCLRNDVEFEVSKGETGADLSCKVTEWRSVITTKF